MRTAHATFSMSLVGDTECALLILPARAYGSEDRIDVKVNGDIIDWTIVAGAHDTRQLVFTAPEGTLQVSVATQLSSLQRPIDGGDPARYVEDSRYIEASALRDFVDERFGRASGFEQLDAMRSWIARDFTYSPGMSAIDDSAVTTLQKRGGMCRDYAHVMIALARAAGIPARYVGVYAPGLVPADFHAVAEVFVDDDWWVIDPTGLAPRGSLIRIATGADALETAWATTTGNPVVLTHLVVDARDDQLPEGSQDDPRGRYQIL